MLLLNILAFAAIEVPVIYGIKKISDAFSNHEEKKRAEREGDITPGLCERIRSDLGVQTEFRFSERICSPDNEQSRWIYGRNYRLPRDLCVDLVETYKDRVFSVHGIHIDEYSDRFHHHVVAVVKSVPTFDSGDREYDSRHTLYLFHNEGRISAAYVKEGYRIAELYVLKDLQSVGEELKPYLEKAGFPLKKLTFVHRQDESDD